MGTSKKHKNTETFDEVLTREMREKDIAITSASPYIRPLNQLLTDIEFTFGQCMDTAIKKNNDYGGGNNDPYANFRNSLIAGVSIEQGIVVRMADKMSRIGTLLQKESMVKDEAIEDTLIDLINYAAILKSYLKSQKIDPCD